MRVTQTFANTVSKQRLRVDIDKHIQDFLDQGGRIEVVSQLAAPSANTRLGWWPEAVEIIHLPSTDNDQY